MKISSQVCASKLISREEYDAAVDLFKDEPELGIMDTNTYIRMFAGIEVLNRRLYGPRVLEDGSFSNAPAKDVN